MAYPGVIFNSVALALLTASIVLLLSKRARRVLNPGSRYALICACMLYAFVNFSNITEHSMISAIYDPAEDIVEVVALLLFMFFVHSWHIARTIGRIREREAWLQATFASLGDGVVTCDPAGRIQQINQEMERLICFKQPEVKDRSVGEVLRFADPKTKTPLAADPFEAAIHSEQTVNLPEESVLLRQDQNDILVHGCIAPIIGEDGHVWGAVGIIRDVSEQVSLKNQLAHAHKMEAIGQLAGGVAHDFNNMLVGIIGAADLLALQYAGKEDDDFQELIDIILTAADRASSLTSQLLAFGRKDGMLASTIDLHEMIDNTLAIAERTIDKRVQIGKVYAEEELIITGDRSQLQNALLNLLLNARDAIPGAGNITVSTGKIMLDEEWCEASAFELQAGVYAAISVQDTGAGMPSEIQNRIFEPFFTTKPMGKGTGLGLAAVYGTVKHHHGAIKIYTEEGVGTVFHLYLPLSESGVPVEPVEPELVVSGGGCVLVIDDEELLRVTAELMLSECGYQVFVAPGGEEGLALYRENIDQIDAVLLDMIMPKLSGSEVLQELLKINPDVRVLLCSGFMREASIPDGAAGYIPKPYRRNELLRALHQVCSDEA
ncbi:response regulator [Candidatus Sumerlaeota bacterium]|nr:response regulator [Candidatus Sumerlaeota bacterium]